MASTFQQYVQPAQELFNFQRQPYSHTQYEQLPPSYQSTTPRMPDTPGLQDQSTYSPGFPDEYKPLAVDRGALARLTKLERRTDQVFGVADLVSCLLTLFMESIMAYVLVKFYQTRSIPAPGRTSPWATGTKLWPTYMLASVALVAFILSVAALVLMCRKSEHKKTSLAVKVVRIVLSVGLWVTVIVFYRVAKTGKDLWGWSCSEKAAGIQQYYHGSLDFEMLCKIQTSSWMLTIAEAVVKIILAGVGFHYQAKAIGVKKSMAKSLGKAGWESLSAQNP